MRKLGSVLGVAVVLLVTFCLPLTASAQREGDIRLVNGGSPDRGRVEIFHDGEWGTVCDDDWDLVDASVACRQLGFFEADQAPGNAFFGQGVDPIWMDQVDCDGSEQRLEHCPFEGFGNNDCSHGEDAGAVCSGTTPLATPAMSIAAQIVVVLALIASGVVILRRRRPAA